jgi:hypothetical protein
VIWCAWAAAGTGVRPGGGRGWVASGHCPRASSAASLVVGHGLTVPTGWQVVSG